MLSLQPKGLQAQAKNDVGYAENDAKVWTFWHWVHGAISKEGLTADLEAMKSQGIGGAYIFAIRDTVGLYENQLVTYTQEWMDMVKYTAKEANRLGIELGFNTCDGFTTAGGPWITPELSMQKLVWADTIVEGSGQAIKLPELENYEGYSRDIAVFAYPVDDYMQDSWLIAPSVKTNMKNEDVSYLSVKGNEKTFSSKKEGYIEYAFKEPFTCSSVQISTGWANYQSNRLIIEISDDGVNFKTHARLEPPRTGWQDLYQPNTQQIEPVTAKHYRFVFKPEGSEPGAEDIDDAKWTPKLQLKGLRLFSVSRIHQYEGKNASIWRIASETKNYNINKQFVAKSELQNITKHVLPNGTLNWIPPHGKWNILCIGHTSTGRENYIGGGARGLECDKLNEDAVKLQFDKWFGEIYKQIGKGLAKTTVTRLLCDSWECGSQNWTAKFPKEFEKRRGYSVMPYLPVMAGVPIEDAETSERVLRDVRETIAELFAEKFSGTMLAKAQQLGVKFVSESNAPTGVGDGMLHHKYTDYPMGEFWFQSPSHDKPNDILDAISAAHIYGKPVVQAESFTEIRLDWNETPAMLKPYADRNLALGVNKIVNHVFVHNPWIDRKPGATLDKVGTFLQRDQTWWNMSYGFWNYLENCQTLLQKGVPVVDIAVFTGEEVPRRAILPDRLVDALPGLMGSERLIINEQRLLNEGFPKYQMPRTVSTQANMARPEDWLDPLRGYNYDSFNKDALLSLAEVKDGKIILPSGMSYSLLVIPGNRKMAPHGGERMSIGVAKKLCYLLNEGATILMQQKPEKTISLHEDDAELREIIKDMFSGEEKNLLVGGEKLKYIEKGRGKLILGSYNNETLDCIELAPDFSSNQTGKLAWNHRQDGNKNVYFIANQIGEQLSALMTFRINDEEPVIYNPVTNEYLACRYSLTEDDRTTVEYRFDAYESVFVIFGADAKPNLTVQENQALELNTWTISFNSDFGCAQELSELELFDWTTSNNEQIKYYSGEAIYRTTFDWNGASEAYLFLGKLHDVAEVKLNNRNMGVVWTAPYKIKLNDLKKGHNVLEIKVANTWNNRLIGDNNQPAEKRVSWTTAPYRLEGQPLLPAGLLGKVIIK